MNNFDTEEFTSKLNTLSMMVLDLAMELEDLICYVITNQLQGRKMDKKMHQVTKKMKTAEKDIKKGKKKEAVKVLKSAEKKNEKLVKIDKNVRDPIIEKAEKVAKTVLKSKKK